MGTFVGGFGWAVLVHEKSVFGSAEAREEGCEVGPGFGVCDKGLVHVVWDVGDEGADAAIVEVHGVDVSNSNTANTVDDDVVFVASVGADGKVVLFTYVQYAYPRSLSLWSRLPHYSKLVYLVT